MHAMTTGAAGSLGTGCQAAHHVFAAQANQAIRFRDNWTDPAGDFENPCDWSASPPRKGKAGSAAISLTASATARPTFSVAELAAVYNTKYSLWRAASDGHRVLKAVIMCGAPMDHEDHKSLTAAEGGAVQREPAGSMSVAVSDGAPSKHTDPPHLPQAVCICSMPNTCPYKLAAAAAVRCQQPGDEGVALPARASTTQGSGSEARAASSGACKPRAIEGGAGAGDAPSDPVGAPKPGGAPAKQGASSGTGNAPASCRPPHADPGGDSRASTALTTHGAGTTVGRPMSAGPHGSTGGKADAHRAALVPPTPYPDRGQETPPYLDRNREPGPVRLRRAPVLAPDGTWHLGTWRLASAMREARLPPLPGYDRSAPFGASDLASIRREIQPAPLPGPDPSPKPCRLAHARTRSAGASVELATLPAPNSLTAISERPAATPALRVSLALPALRGLGAASGRSKDAPKSPSDLPGASQACLYPLCPSCLSFPQINSDLADGSRLRA